MRLTESLERGARLPNYKGMQKLSDLIEVRGDHWLNKHTFTTKQVFGNSGKLSNFSTSTPFTKEFARRHLPHFVIDDGGHLYHVEAEYKGGQPSLAGAVRMAIPLDQDIKLGHEHMFERGHFELTAIDPNYVDDEVMKHAIKERKLEVTFDGRTSKLITDGLEAEAFNVILADTGSHHSDAHIDTFMVDLAVYLPHKREMLFSTYTEATVSKAGAQGQTFSYSFGLQVGSVLYSHEQAHAPSDALKSQSSDALDVTELFNKSNVS